MKIHNETISNKVKFEDLKLGDTFRISFDGMTYVKLHMPVKAMGYMFELNCFCLDEAQLIYISPATPVIRVDVTVNVRTLQ